MTKAEPWRKRPNPPKSEREKFRDRLFTIVDRLLRAGVTHEQILSGLSALIISDEESP